MYILGINAHRIVVVHLLNIKFDVRDCPTLSELRK